MQLLFPDPHRLLTLASADELEAGIRAAFSALFSVFDTDVDVDGRGTVAARARCFGPSAPQATAARGHLPPPPGTYRMEVLAHPPIVLDEVDDLSATDRSDLREVPSR